MTRRKISYLQGTVAAPYKLPAEDHRLNHSMLWTPDNAAPRGPLGVRSGIVAGPGNPGAVTVVAGGVNVAPFQAAIQGTVNQAQGPYEVVSDAVEFRAITAASATEFRRGYVIAHVYDQINAGTGTVKDDWDVEVVYGPNAATAGAATLPTLANHPNSLILREFAVSNTGVITLVGKPTWTTPRAPTLVVATEQAAKDLFAAVSLPVGFTFWATDTGARGHVAPDGLLIWFDTKWQDYTLRVSANAAAPWVEATYGNAVRVGQFYRKGREVSVRGYFQFGSTTSWNGANSSLHFSFPPGYAPKLPPGLATPPGLFAPIGTGRMVGGGGGFGVFMYWNSDAATTAANRWFTGITHNDVVINGGVNATSMTVAGHLLNFMGNYETAFEA